MFDWIQKFVSRLMFFGFTFFLLYILSFWIGMKLVEPFFSGNLQHPIRNLFYGCIVGSCLSFVITAVIHLVYKKLFKSVDFSSWFRGINLIFLYLSGLATAIVSMKALLMNQSLVTGQEVIFNDQFSLLGMVFFIALFNYNMYNSFVLSKEISTIDWIRNRFRGIRDM
ncbi:hypothetical protein AB4114_22270 [Paenibacillus sp. 2RAB27]|uniref:hypothetical protein n=1 Tax=Paenibacillus sp. 2RAB27 TaxID=3232991 RepID=UPI003F99BF7A